MFSAKRRPKLQRSLRPRLELLEDRSLLSANVLQTNLVSDLAGVAAIQDSHLVNPWGISESPGSPFWISDNNAGVSTLYNVPGANNTPVSIVPLVVSIPSPGDPLGATGTPTGTVFNIDLAGNGFRVSGVSKAGTATSAPAIFLFATEDGTLVGWNPGVNPQGFDPAKAGTYGTIAVDNSANPTTAGGAVYKGMTIATGANGPIFSSDPNSTSVLYVSNFRAGTIEVYNTNFKPVSLPKGTFADSDLPKGYAPFNVQVLNGKVYVTYAKQNADKHDDVAGPGHGFVDVFNLDGTPGLANGRERLISRGPLNSPWGLAIAPPSFGSLVGDLLVGNFGNGRIHIFNASTGELVKSPDDPHGELLDPDGEPIQIDGLWALKVGNGAAGGDANTVYFTAGLFGETHGLFGSLKPVAKGTPEGPAEEQMVQAALDVVQLDLTQLQQDIASGASRSTIIQDIRTLNADVVQFVRSEIQFARDESRDGGASSKASAERALETVFAELGSLKLDLD